MAAKGPTVHLFSLHGLIRANNLEMGRDADTGGQVVLEGLQQHRECGMAPNAAKKAGCQQERCDFILLEMDMPGHACLGKRAGAFSGNHRRPDRVRPA